MPQRVLIIVALAVLAMPATADVWFSAGVGLCDQMSEFDKDVIYTADQYQNTIDVHHGGLSYRVGAGAALTSWLDGGLQVELLRSRTTADDNRQGTYSLDGVAIYATTDAVLARRGSRTFSLGVGLGHFSVSGDLEAFGEPFDPEQPAGFEHTPATLDGSATYLDVHAAMTFDVGRSLFLRPSLEARLMAVSDPEVSIDDSRRPAGVDPRPEGLDPAADSFELDYTGMVVRLELGYRF